MRVQPDSSSEMAALAHARQRRGEQAVPGLSEQIGDGCPLPASAERAAHNDER
jgi:hypothetical protein